MTAVNIKKQKAQKNCVLEAPQLDNKINYFKKMELV